MKEEWE